MSITGHPNKIKNSEPTKVGVAVSDLFSDVCFHFNLSSVKLSK